MRIAFAILLVVMGLFAGALLRTEAVLACPARTTPHFPGSNFGVFAAYEALDGASKADQAQALTTYFFNNCRGSGDGSIESDLVHRVDTVALIAVSPFVSFDTPFLLIQLQAQP